MHSSAGFIFHRIKQPSPLSNYTIFSSPPPSMLLLFGHPVVSDSVTPWTAARQTSLSLTIYQSLPKFMIITSVMLSSHLILWCPLLLLPLIFPSIRDFSSEYSVRIRWPKYRNFSFSISPSSEYSGWSPLISPILLTGLISLLSEGLSGVFSSTTVLNHQFFGILPSLRSSSHNPHQYKKLP